MRVLFCPLASHGFVYPAIAVARALRELGHEVAFATGPAFQGVLEQAEIERIQRGKTDGPSFQIEAWFQPLSIAMQVKHIEVALAAFAPDVLVGNPLALGPVLVAERACLPLAVLGFAAHLWPIAEVPSRVSETDERLAWRHDDMMRYFNAARRLFKLAPSDAGPRQSPFLGDLFMLQSVPELVGDVEPFPGRVHLVGACLWEPAPDADLLAWLGEAGGAERPLIYVHHGRAFDSPSFWSEVVDGLGSRPVRVAAAIGRMDRAASGTPANFFVRDHLGQGAVLSRARMVLSGGNTMVVLGALAHGLPALLLPGAGEQKDVAGQVERAGAARILPLAGVSAEALGTAVDQLLGDSVFARRAAELRQAFAATGGPRRAAHLIERLGSSRAPVLRGPASSHGETVDQGA